MMTGGSDRLRQNSEGARRRREPKSVLTHCVAFRLIYRPVEFPRPDDVHCQVASHPSERDVLYRLGNRSFSLLSSNNSSSFVSILAIKLPKTSPIAMLLTEMLMGFCVLHHYMEPIAVAAPVEGAQPLVDVAVGDHGHGLSMPADPPLFGIKDASGTLGQSGQTVVKDSHDAEASAVVKPTVPQTSTGGSPGQEPLLKCVGHVEADAKHFAREWLSTPVKVTFYEKGINFENVPTSISFTQFCEDPELYGFTEDEKEKVITELMARPGGNEIIRMSKGEGGELATVKIDFPRKQICKLVQDD
ncbi:hypothetical protein Pst134EB_024852 [Puccinia striiformis f. sp. tritici]|nr:hypothetical protein Pst134EB_024852 [Puccinia striiformis f. sp. tritici]